MVLRDINRLIENIPEIENIVTFYDDGTVFQTTFNKVEVNIPKLGSDLATILSLFKNLQAKNNFSEFVKVIYDGVNVSLLIFKAGEQSNVALFFKREMTDKEIQNLHIRNYIDRIQQFMDIDQETLREKEFEKKKNEIISLKTIQDKKLAELSEIDQSEENIKIKEELEKEIKNLEQKIIELEEEIEKLK